MPPTDQQLAWELQLELATGEAESIRTAALRARAATGPRAGELAPLAGQVLQALAAGEPLPTDRLLEQLSGLSGGHL